MHRHTVSEGVSPTPLNRYLTRAFPSLPGWLIRETLKKKDVRINGIKSGAEGQCACMRESMVSAPMFARSLSTGMPAGFSTTSRPSSS